MENESRNTGIMIAVVITSIIIVLLVLFIRPKDITTVERVVDNQTVNSLIENYSNFENRLTNLEIQINDIEEDIIKIEDTVQNKVMNLETDIENKLQNAIYEIEELRYNLVITIIVGILLFIIIFIMLIKNFIDKNKINKINSSYDDIDDGSYNIENKKNEKKNSKKENKNEILNVEENSEIKEVNSNQEEIDNNEEEDPDIIELKKGNVIDTHGSYKELSGREQRIIMNSPFIPKES